MCQMIKANSFFKTIGYFKNHLLDSRASTTYLTSPSGAEKRGNPLLCSSDILDRLSRSLPPSQVM